MIFLLKGPPENPHSISRNTPGKVKYEFNCLTSTGIPDHCVEIALYLLFLYFKETVYMGAVKLDRSSQGFQVEVLEYFYLV